MEPERTVELGTPITGLSPTGVTPGMWLMAHFKGGGAQLVNSDTGEVRTDDRKHPEGMFGPDRVVTLANLTARADGNDITVLRGSREIRRLVGHDIPVVSLGSFIRADEPLLVSGSEGGTVRVWSLRTGELVSLSRPSPISVLMIYPGPDGRFRIASGGPTGRLQIWNPDVRVPPQTGLVEIRGFNDRAAREDLLNRGNLVQALAEVLKPSHDDAPTVITVEGAWGSGKSTLLGLVKDRLATTRAEVKQGRRLTVFAADRLLWRPQPKKPRRTNPSKIMYSATPLVVSFNPWRHQSSEQVWAGLAKAVTEAAEAATMPHQNTRERYWFTRNAVRVDRRHLQRQLWRRIFSPLLTLAGLGFVLSVLNTLTRLNISWAWWATGGVAAAGVLHTALRYFFTRASAFLPGELFAGPVVSNAFAGATTDPLIRDPYYHARAGYLYLVQHDVEVLVNDLAAHHYELILLIDDLDRCTPRTTAQVFEAINVFLSDEFPATKFVLGLDTTVVAAHVDNAYKELADANVVTHPDDPSPGWTFLRKLVQLPVRLPRTTADNVDRVLLAQLGPVYSKVGVAAPEEIVAADFGSFTEAETDEKIEQEYIAIEKHPVVREHLRDRLRAQPEQSVREEKRLLNTWQFYLRVLGSAHVEEAGDLVAVAEIATRWPAYLHRLRGGWHNLADAVDDDVQWGATIAKLGFAYSDRKAAANLRELLRDCDAQAVAVLANRLF